MALFYYNRLLPDHHFRHTVALTHHIDTGLRVVYTHALQIEVFNRSIVETVGSHCTYGCIGRKLDHHILTNSFLRQAVGILLLTEPHGSVGNAYSRTVKGSEHTGVFTVLNTIGLYISITV